MIRVKICGITRPEDAMVAMEAGAHALGLVFHPLSPRYLEPQRAREMVASLPPLVSWVGVFVDRSVDEVLRVAEDVGLDTIQLHGHEGPRECGACREEGFRVIKAVRVASQRDLEGLEAYRGAVSAFLLDTKVPGRYGGTGRTFPWELVTKVEGVPIILAGGLNPGNVVRAIERAQPWGVDVSSGVEKAPGVKDHELVRLFVGRATGGRKRRVRS